MAEANDGSTGNPLNGSIVCHVSSDGNRLYAFERTLGGDFVEQVLPPSGENDIVAFISKF
jgi:hypothetical protein